MLLKKNVGGTLSAVSSSDIANMESGNYSKGRIIVPKSPEVTLDPSVLQSFTVTRSICVGNQYTIGSCVMSELEVTMLTSEYNSLVYEASGTERAFVPNVVFYPELQINNAETPAYLRLGSFTMDDSLTESGGLFTTVHAFDCFSSKSLDKKVPKWFRTLLKGGLTGAQIQGYLNGNAYGSNSINLGITFSGLEGMASNYYGVEVEKGTTFREAISQIAACFGKNCITPSEPNSVVFMGVDTNNTTDSHTVAKGNFLSLDITARNATTVGFFAVEDESDDAEIIKYPANGSGVGIISDKAYVPIYAATKSRTQDCLEYQWAGSFANRTSYTYQPHSLSLNCYHCIEPLDTVTVTDMYDNVWMLTPFTVSITYNGSIVTSISADAIEEDTGSTYSSVSSSISNVYSKVDETVKTSRIRWFSCDTAGGTAAKVCSGTEGVEVYKGYTCNVKFDYVNSASDSTLTVGSTTAPIYAGASVLPISSIYAWGAGEVSSFLYDCDEDGTNGKWIIVGSNPAQSMDFVEGAGLVVSDATKNYNVTVGSESVSVNANSIELLKLSSDGIRVGREADNGEYPNVVIDADGVSIKNGGSELAATSDSVILSSPNTFSGSVDYAAGTATLTNSLLRTSQVSTTSTTFQQASDSVAIAWQMRSNGHLSLKVV